MAGQGGQGLFGAPGPLPHLHQAAHIVGEAARAAKRGGQGGTVVHLPGHLVQHSPQGGGLLLLGQQGQPVADAHPRMQQKGQPTTQAADGIV